MYPILYDYLLLFTHHTQIYQKLTQANNQPTNKNPYGQPNSVAKTTIKHIKKTKMLKSQLKLSKLLFNIQSRATNQSQSSLLVEPFKGQAKQFFNHHFMAKSKISRQAVRLQAQLRKCLTIKQVNEIYKQHHSQILSSQKYATIIIEFLLEFYIDPNKNSFRNLQKDLQVYEFLTKYMDQTDKQGISGFSFHDLIQLLSMFNRLFVYYNDEHKYIKWKKMLTMIEQKILDELKKQPSKSEIGITEIHNLLIAADYRQNQNLTVLILKQLNQIIIFKEQNVNYQMILFTLAKTMNEIGLKNWRSFRNLPQFVIDGLDNKQLRFKRPCQLFIQIVKLRLHLIGPKTIPPILKRILNHININKSYYAPKLVCQVLNAFKLLPLTYEQKNFRQLFQFCKQNISNRTFFILSVPYQRLRAPQIRQIQQNVVQKHRQMLWSQGVFFFGYQQNLNYVFGQGKNVTAITKSVQQMLQKRLRDDNEEIINFLTNFIGFANLFDEKNLTAINQKGKRVSYSYLVARKIIQALQSRKRSKLKPNLSQRQIQDHQTSQSIKFYQRLLTVLSIRNMMSLFKIFSRVKDQKFDQKNIDYQKQQFLPRALSLISKVFDRRSSKIFFSTFEAQVIANFEQNGPKNVQDGIKRISLYLICHLIVNKYQESQRQKQIFKQVERRTQKKQENKFLISNFQSNKRLDFQQVKFKQFQIENLMKKIKDIPSFDFQLYFKIIFIILHSPEYNKPNVSRVTGLQVALVNILLEKLPRSQQSKFIQYFIMLSERNKFACKHMFQLLLARNTSIKNMFVLVGALTNQQLKSTKGVPVNALTKYFELLVTNQEVLSSLDKLMKNKKQADEFIDVKTMNLALQKLNLFINDSVFKKFIREVVLGYLNYFPLPDNQSQQFDSFYHYNDAFDILRLASQIIAHDEKNTPIQAKGSNQAIINYSTQHSNQQENVTQDLIQQMKQQFVQQKQDLEKVNASDNQRYSISSSKFERKKNVSIFIHQRAQKIFFITKKLMASIQLYKKNIALDHQTKFKDTVFHSLRHLLRQLQIQSNLCSVLPISILQQQNLIDQILLQKQSHLTLKIHENFPNRWGQNRLVVQEQFHALNSELVILKAFCSDKIRLQDNRIELIRFIRSVQSSADKGKLTSNHLRAAFSVFPASFVADMNKIRQYSLNNDQGKQNIIVDCKQRFDVFLLPIIQRVAYSKARIFQNSLYLIEIIAAMNKITKQEYSTPYEKINAYNNQRINMQKNNQYQLKITKFRYNQVIKTLIYNIPRKLYPHQIKQIIKYLDQNAIFNEQIMEHLANQIKHSSYYLADYWKQIFLFLARSNFLNSFHTISFRSQPNIITQVASETFQVLSKQIQIFAKIEQQRLLIKSKQTQQTNNLFFIEDKQHLVLGRYINYIWAMMSLHYNPLRDSSTTLLNNQLQAVVNMKKDSLSKSLIIIFARDIINRISTVKDSCKINNQKEQFFQINSLELMFVKIYQFILIMGYCLRNLNQNNFDNYKLLQISNENKQFSEKLNKILLMTDFQAKKMKNIDVQRQVTNVLQLDANRMRNYDFQRQLKQKGKKFYHCFGMKPQSKTAQNQIEEGQTQAPLYDYFFDYYLPEQRKAILMIRPRFLDYSMKHQTGQFKVNILIAKLYIFMINRGRSTQEKIKLAIYDPRKFSTSYDTSVQHQNVICDQEVFLRNLIK